VNFSVCGQSKTAWPSTGSLTPSRWLRILEPLHYDSVTIVLRTPPLALYVHLPWCVRKCPYCDFNSYALRGALEEQRYLEALQRDLDGQAGELAGREVISVFFGGGTPSLFAPRSIARVLEHARRRFALASDLEVTLEANPGTVERGRFSEYRAAGVNRVSLGAQTFERERLDILGRIHSPEETRRAAEELHEAGLGNFNLDLMYGLPGQDAAAASRDIAEALALSPAHVSHYQLTLEPGTVFAAHPPELPEDEEIERMFEVCREQLARGGFTRYEVSAYALGGRRCRHNLNYWSFGDYVGIGAGAHGKLTRAARGQVTRTVRPREPRRYLAAANAGAAVAVVPRSELPFEFMLNALRLVEGFEVSSFIERTGLPWHTVGPTLAQLTEEGLLLGEATWYRASPLGLRFLNEVLLRFVAQSPKTVGDSQMSTVPARAPEPLPGALFTGARGRYVE
jgi:oxygen-independent coproporphyrinogen-3 oxidase